MIFGYVSAVLAGFLFTAVPNWTGRMPRQGAPLAVLVALWIAGRLTVAGVGALPAWAVMAIDAAFPLAVAAMIAVEIVAGRNWRNLKVLIPVSLFGAANIGFHLEAMARGSAEVSARAGLAVVVFLILLIGGRIVPSFTRNWLAKRGSGALPAPFGKYDAAALAGAGLALGVWTAAPDGLAARALLALAGLLHAVRLMRWQGARCLASPLLLMLHVAYAFVPAGFAALAAGAATAGTHLLGVGAIGGMTLAVMMRATMGHTGRPLVAGGTLAAAFGVLVAAALIRSFAPYADLAGLSGLSGLTLAAGLWTIAFAIFLGRVGPWLAMPSAARRRPN
jgi:uncharacterized protein involved in response to NO